jgi:hypothetical protein
MLIEKNSKAYHKIKVSQEHNSAEILFKIKNKIKTNQNITKVFVEGKKFVAK